MFFTRAIALHRVMIKNMLEMLIYSLQE